MFNFGSTVWPGLAKVIEEAGEVQQVAGKLIASDGESDHWDGTDLRERLEDEMADLIAAATWMAAYNDLDAVRMETRVDRKLTLFDEWHADNLQIESDNSMETV
jgi:NTP pyrophosphatase (non-canonical NTP hydrolase)